MSCTLKYDHCSISAETAGKDRATSHDKIQSETLTKIAFAPGRQQLLTADYPSGSLNSNHHQARLMIARGH